LTGGADINDVPHALSPLRGVPTLWLQRIIRNLIRFTTSRGAFDRENRECAVN
jgi:hypothetical protein